ncbi:hypothetical protein V5799_007016 [Amblyomma americanum]|uniref:Uncharacterized protein n=1 Tax=Amblyomma americanum TaxID=6943 RepID=A0AAQ4DUR7_AMBAM
MATMERGGGDEATQPPKTRPPEMYGGPQASKGGASACCEVIQSEPRTVSFNCKFHENAMRAGGDASVVKAPLSPIPSRMLPIYLEDQDFVPEELKMGCLLKNGYTTGDLGRHDYVFRPGPAVKPALKNQPLKLNEKH